MKKLLILLALLFVPSSASAQVGNMFLRPFAGVPSGVCAEPLGFALDTTNGDFYSCDAGAWVKIGPGAAATGYQTIEDEGTPLTQRTTVNMIGTSVACVDNGAGLQTDCTFTGGAGATHEIDGVALTAQDPINFLDTSVFDWTNPAAGNLSLAIKAASLADSLMASSYSGIGSCTNQFARTLNDDAAPTCATVTVTDTSGTFPADAHDVLSSTHGDTTAAVVSRGSLIVGKLATPKWEELVLGGVNLYLKSNGTDLVYSTLAASGVGACAANQFETGDNADAVPTCAQPDFADLSGTASAAQIQEVIALVDLTDVTSTTGGGTVSVLGANPTLTDVTVNDVVFFTETAGDQACVAGDFHIKANSTSNLLRGCENGSLFTLSAGGGDGVGYDEVLDEGTGLTKRAQVNFIGANISCVDNGASTRTDCTVTGGGGGAQIRTIRIPIDYRNPRVSSLFSNWFFVATGLTDWDAGHWEAVQDVDGKAYGVVNIPTNVATTPNAKIVFSIAANAITGVTRQNVATAAIADGESLNPAALVDETAQDVTVPATARFRKDVTFTLTNPPAADDILIVEIFHEGTQVNDTLAVNTEYYDFWLEIDVNSGGTHDILSATHSDTTAAAVVRGDLITGQTATPEWTRLALGGTNLYPKSDGTDIVYSTLAAGGVGACTNQFVSALNADAAPTCDSLTLDSIIAAAGAASINSGDNAIVWNWQLTTSDKVAFKFGENVAGTATGDPILLNAVTLAASTVHPFQATARGTANGIRVGAADGVLIALGTGGLNWPALLGYPTGCTNEFVRTIADTLTCNSVGTADISLNAADDTIIRDSAGFSVIGKSTTGTGDPADIVAADETVLGRTAAGNLVFAQVATGQITNSAVTSLKLATANKTFEKSIVIIDPTTAEDDKVQWMYGKAVTVISVDCSTNQGTVTIDMDHRVITTPNTVGTDILTGTIVCDTDNQADGGFADATIPANVPVNLSITAVSGTPGTVRIHVIYTVD